MKSLISNSIILITLLFRLVWLPTSDAKVVKHLSGLSFQHPADIPQPVDNLLISRKINPSTIVPGQPAAVTLSLQIPSNDACQGIPGQPVDIMFVYDTSTSAGFGPGSNWETTIAWTKALVANFSQPVYQDANESGKSKVGLISSQTGVLGPEPVLLQPLTDDYSILSNRLGTMMPGGDTDIAAGLVMAEQSLSKSRTADRSQAIVIFLHDNLPLNKSMEQEINAAISQNINVYLLANSLNIPNEQKITEEITRELILSSPVFINPNSQDLRKVFIASTRGNPGAIARSIIIKENYAPDGQVDLFNSSDGGNIVGQTITWNIPLYEQEQQDLSYEVDFKNLNIEDTTLYSDIYWIDCNGYPHSRQDTRPGIQALQQDASSQITNAETDSTENIDRPNQAVGIPALKGLSWLPGWLLLLILLSLLFSLIWLFFKLRRNPSPPSAVAPPRIRENIAIADRPQESPKQSITENRITPGVTTQYIQIEGITYRFFKSVQPSFGDSAKFLSQGGKITIARWVKAMNKDAELARIVLETSSDKPTRAYKLETTSQVSQFRFIEKAFAYSLLQDVYLDMKALGSISLSWTISLEDGENVSFLKSNGFEFRNNVVIKKI